MGTYTEISSERCDANKPVNEDLVGDLAANTVYNFDHALRCGEDGTPVRLAFARGSVTFTEDNADPDKKITGSVTFSTDADDGNPNFDSAPTVCIALQENAGGAGDEWTYTGHFGVPPFSLYMESVTSSGFTYVGQFDNFGEGGADPEIYGYFDWIAAGPVSSGE